MKTYKLYRHDWYGGGVITAKGRNITEACNLAQIAQRTIKIIKEIK